MFNSSPETTNAIPHEYRAVAEALFPPKASPASRGPKTDAALAYADMLGIGKDYRNLLDTRKNGEALKTFLSHFQNNLDLLIQKTWVEKADEKWKTKLQDEIPLLISDIIQGEYYRALLKFGEILDELAYLLFGAQSKKSDFTEYAIRIDPQMGMFWWYGGQLGSLREPATSKSGGSDPGKQDQSPLWSVLLIGICYLTNF